MTATSRFGIPPLLRSQFHGMLLLLAAACWPAASAGAAPHPPPAGLWLLPRKDPQNTARADVPGRMNAAPAEVWAYGGDPDRYTSAWPLPVGGADAYLCQCYSGLRLLRPDGTIVWDRPTMGVSGVIAAGDFGGRPAALVLIGSAQFALIDGATGATRWTWSAPPDAALAPNGSFKIWRHDGRAPVRLIVFPQNSLHGVCLDLTADGDQPAVLWDREYAGYWKGFGPQIVLADMDKDGVPDIVLAGKPGYAAVIGADSGAVKFDAHYDIAADGIPGGDHAGRPYGLLAAADLDGDGFPDLVMLSCQVEEYLSVLHNEAGKALRPAWSKFIEHDLPDDLRELRPNVTSLADLNGDGRRQLVVGLFNVTGDGRWHTVVIDPLKGFDARLADLPGRYFWGCYDLDGDGRPQIITSTEPVRKPAAAGAAIAGAAPGGATIQAVDGRTFRDLATLDRATLATAAVPTPADVGFMALRNTPRFHRTPDGHAGLLLSSLDGKPVEALWSLHEGRSQIHPVHLSPHASLVALSTGTERLDHPDLTLRPRDDGPGATPLLSATAPLVGIAGGRRELVFALSDGTVLGGEPDFHAPGRFKSSWTVPGQIPALWLGPDGDRVVCTVTADQTILLSRPTASAGATRPASQPARTLALPYPLYRNATTRSGPTLLPFTCDTNHDSLRLYVGLQTGVHTLASALYDETGTRLWLDEKDGPYPRSAAEADLAGRPTLVVDDHGKHLLYDLTDDGRLASRRLIAHGWNDTVPGRGDGGKYVVPIVGPFGPASEQRILMTSGLQALETLDAAGRRLAKHDFAGTYEFEWNGSAVARLRAPSPATRPTGTPSAGPWDLAMVNKQGVITCFDAATCRPRWTFDLGCRATFPINLVAADVDGDGRDNLLAGLPNGSLVALVEKDGKPTVLWKTRFPYGVRDTIVADVDGDGSAAVVVETEEGRIHVLRVAE